MIDKIIVLNLDDRPDKWAGQQAVCGIQGVPRNVLERQSARDSLNYKDKNAVVDAMCEAGFDKYAEHHRDKGGWITQTILAVQFTHLEAITRIIDEDIHALVLEDDTFLNMEWGTLCNVYKYLIEEKECNILYLDSNPMNERAEGLLQPIHCPNIRLDSEGNVTQSFDRPPLVYRNFRWSSCRARVYSPWGAGRMLDIMRTTGLVTEWIPAWLHDPQHRNEKTMLYPEASYHYIRNGAKVLGWDGYDFGNRSDLIARDVGVFGVNYGESHDHFMKGVTVKENPNE